MEPIRISKYFTDCGVLSRRAADAAIEAGEVKVNGIPAVTGQKITPGVDEVVWRGRKITLPVTAQKITIMLNKPRGYVTTIQYSIIGRLSLNLRVRDVDGCFP